MAKESSRVSLAVRILVDAALYVLVAWMAKALMMRAVGPVLVAYHVATFVGYQVIVPLRRGPVRHRTVLVTVGNSLISAWAASVLAVAGGQLTTGGGGLSRALEIDPVGALTSVVLAVPARTGVFVFGVIAGLLNWVLAHRKVT